MGTIYWNGISSSSVPIVVEHPPKYQIPERDYDTIHIPGRSGDLLIDNGSYKNVDRAYDIAFGSEKKTHSEMAAAVSEWLHSAHGYGRLEDTYEPDYYRIASYQEDLEMENILNHLGRATITFNCMPQRFLKSGELPIIISATNKELMNPTRFDAKPLLNLIGGTGAAKVSINDVSLSIISLDNGLTINCDMGEVYKGTYSRNAMIDWGVNTPHIFPYFKPGINVVKFSGAISKVEVIPKWWTL